MQNQNRPQGSWRIIVFGCIGLLVIFADQLSKTWIRANLAPGQSLFDAGFFQIVHVQNSGAAFGIFKGYSFTLTIIALIGIVVILLLVFFLHRRWPFLDSMLARVAIGLVTGGTIGNLIDRISMGHVTDFINFKVWPVFNVADSAVTVGVIIIVYRILYLAKNDKH
ncbi:signal peptidase II [Chloroflexota bacterium]